MFTLSNIQEAGLDYLELKCAEGNSKARFCLDQGGRLEHLAFNTIQVIETIHSSTYKDNYASAILFPFANRVKNGMYAFNGKTYKLYCNENGANNALHGLVYHKKFQCVASDLNADFGSVTLRYNEEEASIGFPFTYKIDLIYKLTKNGISLAIHILNTDTNAFPFTLGWHPYFKSENLYHSSLDFKCKTVFQVDKHLIPIGKTGCSDIVPFQLKNKILDTGYQLEDHSVEFLTPQYHLKIESTSKDNYLQLYTPSSSNYIAIEPMTGAADSFNNKIGLQVLNPDSDYKLEWLLTFKDVTT